MILTVRRFAQARPHKMKSAAIATAVLRRAKAARSRYARTLERALRRQFPDWLLDKSRLSITMDLERSFSPVYARDCNAKGRRRSPCWAWGSRKRRPRWNASLTFALLWLQAAVSAKPEHLVEGLRLYVRRNFCHSQVRLAHLDHSAAKFQLFEFDDRESLQAD